MKITLAVLGGLLVVVAGLLGWLGALSPVQIQEQDFGPYAFVYVQDATTDFKKIGQLTAALGERLEAAGFKGRRPAQIYYPKGRGSQNQIGFVVGRTVPIEILGSDTFFRPIPTQRCMAARFPFRNPLSYIVGYFRVDPAFAAHRKRKNYAETSAMVIHEGDSILYLQPVATGG